MALSLTAKSPGDTGALDRFRPLAALMVVAIHTDPLAGISVTGNTLLVDVLCRVAVPFFLLSTGYFLHTNDEIKYRKNTLKNIKKSLVLYAGATLLYLPLLVYQGYFAQPLPLILRGLLVEGSVYHLWYFPALALGVLLVYGLRRILGLRGALVAAGVLYLPGLLGDSYYGLAGAAPVLEKVYDAFFVVSPYTRNGLFFAPLFLLLGMLAAKREGENTVRLGTLPLAAAAAVLFVLSGMEVLWLRHLAWPRHTSMTVLLVPLCACLFSLLLRIPLEPRPALRGFSTAIYILHPAVIAGLHMLAGIPALGWLYTVGPARFAATAAVTGLAAFGWCRVYPVLSARLRALRKVRAQ